MVHEGVTGLGVFLHVVGNEGALQGLLQLIGDALHPPGQTAVAADDRAGGLEKFIDLLRQWAAVIDAGGRETVVGSSPICRWATAQPGGRRPPALAGALEGPAKLYCQLPAQTSL